MNHQQQLDSVFHEMLDNLRRHHEEKQGQHAASWRGGANRWMECSSEPANGWKQCIMGYRENMLLFPLPGLASMNYSLHLLEQNSEGFSMHLMTNGGMS